MAVESKLKSQNVSNVSKSANNSLNGDAPQNGKTVLKTELPTKSKRRKKKKKQEGGIDSFIKIETTSQKNLQNDDDNEDVEIESKKSNLRARRKQMKKNSDDEHELDSDDDTKDKVSKKKLRKLNRLSVAQLKQLVKRPEVVEWVDVTAADPKLLVSLKAYRNTVPVPQHWCQKRKYLQGKRGIEKPAFELPEFIKDTGIMEMREAVKEKEDAAKLKQKTRERVQPKMGKLDIDYQRLHDAFFRFQAKPKLTIHGELYYEGKEFETKLKEKKPGQLSEELKAALNMPPLAPPPWLIAMQRYGPPPSYPNLKIPGLNAPIPEGAQWGFHPGGWGKPPVDEYNRPLYGDVFGTYQQEIPSEMVQPIERTLWGEMEPEEEESEEEEEEQEEEEPEEPDTTTSRLLQEGLITPSGMASVANGLETPAYIELRKYQNAPPPPPTGIPSLESGLQTPSFIELRKYQREDDEPKSLFTVLPQKESAVSGFMGSQHVYDLSATGVTTKGIKRKGLGTGVDVALDPSEMANLDEETLRAKFEEAQQEHQPEGAHEDFSDMVAEHANKQAKKRQKLADAKAAARDAGAGGGSSQKKYKEFKF